MRDFASCFSEHSVRVPDTSCSGRNSISARESSSPSAQTAATSLYRVQLSTHKDILIKVTWSKTPTGPVLSLGIDADPQSHHWRPGSINSQLLRKRKGSRSFVTTTSVVGFYWDYSLAKFGASPEPVSNFYIVVIVDAELALLNGDLSREYVKRFEDIIHVAEFSLVGRKEQVIGQEVCSTRARFSENGKDHEIVIRCTKESELTVNIDKKRVVHVRRLQWNFRGNQTVFVDGSPVDVMWDVRDWWFSRPAMVGSAVFMFRRRSALVSRLWFEEEILEREKGISGFSLLVQAFKTTASN